MTRLVVLSVPAVLLTLAASDWAYSRNCTAQEKANLRTRVSWRSKIRRCFRLPWSNVTLLGACIAPLGSGGRTGVAPGRLSPVP